MNPQSSGSEDEKGEIAPGFRQRVLPHDLPKSLDDRHPVPEFSAETEMYDAWQGMK